MAYTKQISRGGVLYELNPLSIAGQFSTASSYSAGDYCYYGGYLWRFTSDHSAGAWSGTDAEQTTVSEALADLNAQIETAGAVEIYVEGTSLIINTNITDGNEVEY